MKTALQITLLVTNAIGLRVELDSDFCQVLREVEEDLRDVVSEQLEHLSLTPGVTAQVVAVHEVGIL